MTTATFEYLTVSSEFGDAHTVPASYLLENWQHHARAQAVIRAAMSGRSGSFETPAGLLIVRPAGRAA